MYRTVQFEYYDNYLYVMVWVSVYLKLLINIYYVLHYFVSITNKNMPDYSLQTYGICNSLKTYF